jgi:FkbM family methyltransferase
MLRSEHAPGLLGRNPQDPTSGQLSLTLPRKPTALESGLSFLFRMLPVKHGAHRLLDRLRPSTWVKGAPVVAVPYHGRTLQIDVSDLVGWHFLVMRNFDPEIAEVLGRFACGNGVDVFWDVGANKGALSYQMAVSLPRCKIVAIEPQRALTGLLAENLETLARGRHEVFTVGIGDTPGIFELVIPQDNRGHASLRVERGAGHLVEQVEVVTADTVRRQSRYGWPTVVKIDVEGFEPEVIRSLLPAFGTRRIRCCVFECHASQEGNFQQIRSATEKLGYGLCAITKTPFSTCLVPATNLVRTATDYALVRDDLYRAKCSARVARAKSCAASNARVPGLSAPGELPRAARHTGRRARRWPRGPGWM